MPWVSLLLAAAATQLVACGKTVAWEEDVALDSGATLRVKRFDSYVLTGGENANPFQRGWWIKRRSLKFRWRERAYEFSTPTPEILMIQEMGTPANMVIVAWTLDCETRGYGEYRWDRNRWRLQPTLDPHLVGRRRNLMGSYFSDERELPKLVTPEVRLREDTQSNRPRIDPALLASRIATGCPGTH
jgi:hypothetical protein